MPSVSALVLARLLAAKGNFPTLYGTPCGEEGRDCQRLWVIQGTKATAQLSGWGSSTHLLHKAVTSHVTAAPLSVQKRFFSAASL